MNLTLLKKILKKIIPKKIILTLQIIFPNSKKKILKKLKFSNRENLLHLGTNYGGWSFLNNTNLKDQFIISAGLGEDASFDIEIISKYDCKVIVVDPTPRAIEHYKEIIKNIGNSSSEPYNQEGKLNVSSYDLSKVNKDNFILIDKALYNKNDIDLKFFPPINKDHVSYSLNNWQDNFRENNDFIKVRTTTVKNIMKKYDIKNLEILKLDIEGAEIEVLNNILEEKVFPNQVLVEFDELNLNNKASINRFEKIHKRLLEEKYILIKTKNNFGNFLYVKDA